MRRELREMENIARMSSDWTGKRWYRVGEEIYADRAWIGRVKGQQLCEYIVRLHNSYLPLTHLVVALVAKLADKHNLLKEIADEANIQS